MNTALNILNNMSELNRHSGEPSTILRLISNDKQEEKEELAKSIISIILAGNSQNLINLLTIGVDLRGSINFAEAGDPKIIEMVDEVVDNNLYISMFKALITEGGYDIYDALRRVTDGDVIYIGDGNDDAYEAIGRYYGELLFETVDKKTCETFERYFDYEAYGRDISFEIEWYQTDDGIFEVLG